MRQKDYERLAASIRDGIDRFRPKSTFQLNPRDLRKLERMARDTEMIASSLNSINQKAPQLIARITELLKKADDGRLELEKRILERRIRSEHKPFIDASEARIKNVKADWARKALEAQHETILASLEAHIKSMTSSLVARKHAESAEKKMRAVFLMSHVAAMLKLLQAIQSDSFLDSHHAHLLKQDALDLVKGFKKSSKASTIPQRVEDIVILMLNLPSDLASGLSKLLELRRKLDRLTIETDADVQKVTEYSKDVEQLAERLKEVETNLDRFL